MMMKGCISGAVGAYVFFFEKIWIEIVSRGFEIWWIKSWKDLDSVCFVLFFSRIMVDFCSPTQDD